MCCVMCTAAPPPTGPVTPCPHAMRILPGDNCIAQSASRSPLFWFLSGTFASCAAPPRGEHGGGRAVCQGARSGLHGDVSQDSTQCGGGARARGRAGLLMPWGAWPRFPWTWIVCAGQRLVLASSLCSPCQCLAFVRMQALALQLRICSASFGGVAGVHKHST